MSIETINNDINLIEEMLGSSNCYSSRNLINELKSKYREIIPGFSDNLLHHYIKFTVDEDSSELCDYEGIFRDLEKIKEKLLVYKDNLISC